MTEMSILLKIAELEKRLKEAERRVNTLTRLFESEYKLRLNVEHQLMAIKPWIIHEVLDEKVVEGLKDLDGELQELKHKSVIAFKDFKRAAE